VCACECLCSGVFVCGSVCVGVPVCVLTYVFQANKIVFLLLAVSLVSVYVCVLVSFLCYLPLFHFLNFCPVTFPCFFLRPAFAVRLLHFPFFVIVVSGNM